MGLKPGSRISGKVLLIGRIVAAAVVILFMVYYFHYFYHKKQLHYDLKEYEVVSVTDFSAEIVPGTFFSNSTLIQQEIPPISDEIDAIQILCAADNKHTNGNVILQIQDAGSGEVYLKYTQPCKPIKHNTYITVPLQEMTSEQRAKQLMLTITAECEESTCGTI